MTGSTLATAAVVAVLYGVGTYLMLQRTLTRIVIGLVMMGHGANLLLLAAGGPPGAPPIAGPDGTVPAASADPLPQALALTAIVITFGVVAFLLALAYRSWVATRSDEVEDDLEDRRIARRAARLTSAVDRDWERELDRQWQEDWGADWERGLEPARDPEGEAAPGHGTGPRMPRSGPPDREREP